MKASSLALSGLVTHGPRMKIDVLHGVPSLDPQHGGPSRSVVALADALARRDDCRVGLVSQGLYGAVLVASTEDAVLRQIAETDTRLALALGLAFRQGLQRACEAFSPPLIHSHGVWHASNHWAAWAARRRRVPLVIQPRGMLEPWALGRKAWKKRLAMALYQGQDLALARVLVATAEMEFENLRRLGLRQPVAVIPNGVALRAVASGHAGLTQPSEGTAAGVGEHRTARTGGDRSRVALFLSRVHPKKGVLELVRAWAQVAPAGWRLRIAGPDEGGHWAEVAREVERLRLGPAVEYLGPVEGEAKAALYRQADVFVLPTFSENFGLVVAEALAYGVPVITTRGAPWADLETHACGWWIDTGVAPLAQALRAATALSDAERAAMGARGRVYVQRYDWDRIAEQTAALYRWVLGQGEQPDCVRLN